MKRLLVILALGGAAYTGHRLLADDEPAARPATASLALDRIWIDHIPRGERDTVEVFVAIRSESIGVFQQASQWRGAHELFKFEAQGDQLRLVYPHTGDKDRVTARARACSEGGFDYCLDLAGARKGAKRYFSLEGWEIEGAHGVRELAARVQALLAARTR